MYDGDFFFILLFFKYVIRVMFSGMSVFSRFVMVNVKIKIFGLYFCLKWIIIIIVRVFSMIIKILRINKVNFFDL